MRSRTQSKGERGLTLAKLSHEHRPLLLVILALAAFIPAMCFSPDRDSDEPLYAFPNYITDEVDFETMPSAIGRVYVLITRQYRGDHPAWHVPFLIWLPAVVGLCSVALYECTHAKVTEQYGLAVALAATVVGMMIRMFWRQPWLPTILAIAIVSCSITAALNLWRRRRELRSAGWQCDSVVHFAFAVVLTVSGVAASTSTHVLLTKYDGFALSASNFGEVATMLDTLMNAEAPPYVGDDDAWRIDRLPSLNAFGWKMTLFSLNRFAAILFVMTVLGYIFVWATIIHHHHRPSDWVCPGCQNNNRLCRSQCESCAMNRGYSKWRLLRMVYASAIYLATGVAFAMIFYSDYSTAAAKQNVSAAYADYLAADNTRAARLDEYFDKKGWSDSIEQEILGQSRLRLEAAPVLERFISKARAGFWPSAVIAHETPRVKEIESAAARQADPEQPKVETEFAVNPVMSFHDMLYFSFVSFTTTGYGDVRPVSDRLRFWTIVENIMEILFVAFFIGVAVDA